MANSVDAPRSARGGAYAPGQFDSGRLHSSENVRSSPLANGAASYLAPLGWRKTGQSALVAEFGIRAGLRIRSRKGCWFKSSRVHKSSKGRDASVGKRHEFLPLEVPDHGLADSVPRERA